MKNSKKQNASDIWNENFSIDFRWDYRLADMTDTPNDLQYKEFIVKNYSYDPELHGFTTKNVGEKNRNS